MPQTIYTSKFFYVIRDRRNGMLYAGCKFAEDANPNTFMTEDGYKTSSKDIQQIIDQEGLDTFEIVKLRIMNDPLDYETRFLRKVNAAANPKFYNFHNNNIASFGTESYEQMIIKKYGVTNISMNKELKLLANKKQKLTLNDPVWKETKGKAAIAKTLLNRDHKAAGQRSKQTKSDPAWKETIGKQYGKKISETKSDPKWKETVGDKANQQRIENTDWVELGKKTSKTKNSKEWKEKTYKTCQHCKKGPMDPSNYKRYHGPNCKNKID